jgi:hypothetical protein
MQSIWDAASDRDYYGEQYEDLEENDGDGDGTTVSTTCCQDEENDEKWNG